MTRIGGIHWKKFEKFLLAQGCLFKREEGDHRIHWKPGLKRPIVVPRINLPPHIVLNNIRTLGISRDEYINFIKKL